MKFEETSIYDILIIKPDVYGDDRGFFMETWQRSKFKEYGIDMDFVQDNHSRSPQGVLRGLHYQLKRPQGKLVRVVSGKIYDVAVDIRKSSSTFGKWIGEVLSSENKRMLWVPPGFAHGFYVLSDIAEVCYKCTDYYSPEDERSLIWDDTDLSINWPLIDEQIPTLSEKDKTGNSLKNAEVFS